MSPLRTARLNHLWHHRLYALVDTTCCDDPVAMAVILAQAGVGIIQLRAKALSSSAYRDVAQEIMNNFSALSDRNGHHPPLFVVNDHVQVAAEIAAPVLHLGQDDMSPQAARLEVGSDTLIGLSTHTPTQVRDAHADAAVDYIGMGPMYATTTKPHEPVRGPGYSSKCETSYVCPVTVSVG